MNIAVDAFGSDNAPYPEIEGAVAAINDEYCDKIYLVGKQDVIEKELDKYFYPKDSIEIVDADEIITPDDDPVKAVRTKKNSSLNKSVLLNKQGKVDAVVSAGSTGAVMTASLFTYGRIPGVKRPGLAISLPTQKEPEIILDVGANTDCTVENLVQFAEMGSIYAKYYLRKPNPRVALLNIGEERRKGNELTITTHQELERLSNINFIGNIEGKDILKGIVDVIICDGFIGNIMLKTVEGVAISLFDIFKEQLERDWVAKLGALLAYPVFSYLKRKLDYAEYGGAFLLGVNGISIITHGRSNSKAIKNAIRFANFASQSHFLDHIKEYYVMCHRFTPLDRKHLTG